MSDDGDQASEQARFAARKFVARFEREMGTNIMGVTRDYMLFAFEIGYLRGRSAGAEVSMQMLASTKG